MTPKPITLEEQKELLQADHLNARINVEPVGKHLGLNEAVARGLKHNLDYRLKLMEQAIAFGIADLSNYDMLPKLAANAGYNYRNNYFITYATGAETGNPSLSEPFISSAKDYAIGGLSLSWNLLDFGVSYFNAQQNADKILVASERRRRSMHLLIQDIQAAYLRAASAQHIQSQLLKTISDANQALGNSRKGEQDGLKSPLEALKFRKSLLDNVKILETISQELASAMVDLNQLINQPPNAAYALENPDEIVPPFAFKQTAIEEFEIRALAHNADLKESIYNARIAVLETRKSLLKLLPGLNLNIGPQASSNTYYINKNWVEGAAQLSFNLWNLVTAPAAKRLSEANEEWVKHKRMMVQMALIGQVYVARQQLENAETLYLRSAEIDEVDTRIAIITSDKENEGSVSDAEKVAANASAVISKLRKHQALTQFFLASGKLQSTTGLEPDLDSLNSVSLEELTNAIGKSFEQWNSGKLPAVNLTMEVEHPVESVVQIEEVVHESTSKRQFKNTSKKAAKK
ncbi:TolC family protein [Orrella sp. NBD-18]|uniref:TolC family protein n=1 Tax=Sheuella amnicola TaxID=2707330 RepID=A0A6B2R3R2_9BURK|nr:TolC family protein [Sheuella amnicola]NDY84029.1 TolC family protein [Sheuella amnicola]HBI83269.1 transporter [Alcaligenaceae bacterium]